MTALVVLVIELSELQFKGTDGDCYVTGDSCGQWRPTYSHWYHQCHQTSLSRFCHANCAPDHKTATTADRYLVCFKGEPFLSVCIACMIYNIVTLHDTGDKWFLQPDCCCCWFCCFTSLFSVLFTA